MFLASDYAKSINLPKHFNSKAAPDGGSDLKLCLKAVDGCCHTSGSSICQSCCDNERPPCTKAGRLLGELDGHCTALTHIKNLQLDEMNKFIILSSLQVIHQSLCRNRLNGYRSHQAVFPWGHQLSDVVHRVEDDMMQEFTPVHRHGAVLIHPGVHKDNSHSKYSVLCWFVSSQTAIQNLNDHLCNLSLNCV